MSGTHEVSEPPDVSFPRDVAFPPAFRLRPAPRTRWLTDDILAGGSLTCVVRFSSSASAAVRALLAETPIAEALERHGAVASRAARYLLDRGLANPVFAAEQRCTHDALPYDIAVVIPARDAAVTLPALLSSLPGGLREIVVIDDGSVDATRDVAVAHGAAVIEHETPLGPAAARNAGLRAVSAPAVLLIDADTFLEHQALPRLVMHLSDPAVALVAPRVMIAPADPSLPGGGSHDGGVVEGHRWVAAHEAARSPFDLGPVPGNVAPGSDIPFVPSGAMLVRRDAVAAAGYFDSQLRLGEDVDLTWRLIERGHLVRYEPTAIVYHRHRVDPADAVRRRFHYGTSNGPVSLRHPREMAALTVEPATLGALAAGALGGPVTLAAGLAATVGLSSAALAAKGVPPRPAVEIAAADHIRQLRTALFCVSRPWLPIVAVTALASRRARRLLAFTLVARHLGDWRRSAPALGPLAWIVVRTVDDATYTAGSWWGAATARTLRPFAIRLRRARRSSTPDWVELANFS